MMNSAQYRAWLRFIFADASVASRLAPAAVDDWLRWLSFHQLAAWTFHRLHTAGQLAAVPPPAASRLRQMAFQSAAVSATRRFALHQVLTAFREDKIDVVLLKGSALAFGGAYADPSWREMGDCDLWIRPAQMIAAVHALHVLGYRYRRNADRPLALRVAGQQEVEMIKPGMPGQVMDLHYRPFQGQWLATVLPVVDDELWRRRRPMTIDGIAVSRLAAEDNILHLVAHFAIGHQMGRPGLRALWDVATSLRAWPVDWDLLLRRARRWHLRLPLYLVLRLAADFVAAPLPDSVLRALSPAPLRLALLQRILPETNFLRGARLSASHLRYLYLLFLLDQPHLGLRLGRQALFPGRQWLRLRYTSLSSVDTRTIGWLHLYHLWRVLRYARF